MSEKLKIGEMDLYLVPDAVIKLDGGSVFHPASFEEWGPGVEADENEELTCVVRSLLIKRGEEYTLVDTGYGESRHEERPAPLADGLKDLGVLPEKISSVIITHGHGDHCLGSTMKRAGGWVPAFSEASYYLQEKEAAALDAGDPDLWRYSFLPLRESGLLHLIDGIVELFPGVTCRPTPGHTVGHQSVLVEAAGESALFLGDLALHPRNMEKPEWGPDWAWSREADIESRREIAAWSAETGGILIIGHAMGNPLFRMEKTSGGLKAMPVEQFGT